MNVAFNLKLQTPETSMRYIGNCKNNYFLLTSNLVKMDEYDIRNFWFLMLFRFNILFFQPQIMRGENV